MTSDRFGHRLPYDLAYYDREFFEGKTGEKGRDRTVDSGIYLGHAQALTAMFPNYRDLSILMVGDGIGFASRHLLHMGWGKVTYSDVSHWAVENNAMRDCTCPRCEDFGSIYRADVRDLANVEFYSQWTFFPDMFEDRAYDVVCCINLLGYLDRADVPQALSELKRVCQHRLAIQVAYLDEVQRAAVGPDGRLIIESMDWWDKQFQVLGLVEDEKALERARAAGHNWPHCLKRRDTGVSRQAAKNAKKGRFNS